MAKSSGKFLPPKTVNIDEWLDSHTFLPPGGVKIDTLCLKCGRGLAGEEKLCPACNKGFDWHHCQWCDEEQPHARLTGRCIACVMHYNFLSCPECGEENPHEKDDYKCLACRRAE